MMSLQRTLLITASLSFLAPFAAFAQSDSAASSPATAPAMASAAATSSSSSIISPSAPVTHGELTALVKEAIMNNPEVIMAAVKKLHDKQVEENSKEVKGALAKHKDELFKDTSSPSVGDAKTADVTIIEFFDYHCGYCKHMLPVITQLIKDDPKVRVIFREFPILSEDSSTAARAALAVNAIDHTKYFAFHTALMGSSGKFDEKTIMDIAKKVGIDTKALKKEIGKPEYTAMLDANRKIADDLSIRGTPGLIIGDQVIPGAVPIEDLKKLIETERKGGKGDEKSDAPAAKDAPKN